MILKLKQLTLQLPCVSFFFAVALKLCVHLKPQYFIIFNNNSSANIQKKPAVTSQNQTLTFSINTITLFGICIAVRNYSKHNDSLRTSILSLNKIS